MKIRPLHDRVIVRRMEEERTSPGGIVIPDAATEKPIKGEIVAVGNGKILGKRRNPRIGYQSRVTRCCLVNTPAPKSKLMGEELLVMKEDDIMAVIEG